jgi:hypothetical protein
MDLGINKCAITGCPNKSKLSPTTFKAYVQSHNLLFRHQAFPILHHNESYKYLGVHLVPSLTWKIQIHNTMTKLNEQCKLLKASPATMKQKIHMTDSVIRVGIAYGFYTVAYSMPTINKLDKILIRLHKSICGMPKSTPNIMAQLPQNMFGLEAFSLINTYLRCIGENLRDALNDTGRLGIIFQGLTNYIFAKNGGAQNIPRITQQACVRSPITRTIFLLKHIAGTHIRNNKDGFILSPTPLETMWLTQARQRPNINIKLCHHLLNKLLIYHITSLSRITLPNGTHLMTHDDFTIYHTKPTKIIKSSLKLATQLFCQPICYQHCPQPCPNHFPPNTLLPQFIIPNHRIDPPQPTSQHPIHIIDRPPPPPSDIWIQLKHLPIHSIIDHKQNTSKDQFTIIKKYHSYLCTWIPNNNITYAKWVPQSYIYQTRHANHNYQALLQYYHMRQIKHYNELISKHFNFPQHRDNRVITPPLHLPLVNISITECNPEYDIITTGHTIQVLHNSAFLYDHNGRHLHTIPITRLKWLWNQYNHSLPHLPTLEPPLQSFETEIIWLIYRYKYPNNTQYALPNNILDHLTTSLNITHSYFSSPITCSTLLQQFYSPFPRDCIFGSRGNAFSHKWNGCGFAHPPPQMLPQAIHMARIAAKINPLSYTILINTDPN